jgi:hypothetical protein
VNFAVTSSVHSWAYCRGGEGSAPRNSGDPRHPNPSNQRSKKIRMVAFLSLSLFRPHAKLETAALVNRPRGGIQFPSTADHGAPMFCLGDDRTRGVRVK